MPAYQAENLRLMREFYEYTISQGNESASFGFPLLTEKLEGMHQGIFLVAGAPNLGKTAFMTHLAWNIINHNDNYAVIYLTLDDNNTIVYPRFCALAANIPMNVFKMPRRLAGNPEYQQKYFQGLERLARASDRLIVLDQRIGSDIETIEKTYKEYKQKFEEAGVNKTIILFIDSFHDISSVDRSKMKDDNERYKYVASELKRISMEYNIPIFATAEIRKIGPRRPTLDDIRETGNIIYEANVVFGIYNEVSIKGEAAQIFYRTYEDGPKQPVLEVDFLKNKVSSYKGRLFYHFIPEMSYLHEADPETQRYYETRLHS